MTSKLSRRGFLNLAGAVGGSTTVYRAALALGLLPAIAHAERPQLGTLKKPKKVLILGGGISGLTAAYELSRKGYDVQVLEASFRAGGRNLTVRHGDRIDETGFPQVCNFDKDPDLYFNCGPGAHSGPPQGAAQLLQGARRRARAVHQRQPPGLGAGRRDVRRQAGPRARIHEGLARLRRGAHVQVHDAGTIRGADDERRLRTPARIPQVPGQASTRASNTSARATPGLAIHDYTNPGRAQEAARRPRTAEVAIHADHELR